MQESVGQLLARRAAHPSRLAELSTSSAELGATGYGAEVAATSTPHQLIGKYLGAMTYGVETSYLGVTSHGADLLSPKMQFVSLWVYL